MTDRAGRRRAGLVLPLFSCPSRASWGIGEIADVPLVARWLASAGLGVLQMLPLNEMAPGQHSPYSPLSAMAVDPIFISPREVPEIAAAGGEASLASGERARLREARGAGRVDYVAVREVKMAAFGRAFDRFHREEWEHDTPRAQAFRAFLTGQAWWIEDYALFRAIHAREQERSWLDWPAALQRRDPAAVVEARRELGRDVLYWQYLQWCAHVQWLDARRRSSGVALFGDLPFMVALDSADVWARQQAFDLAVSVGAPPDGFSETGQDWGMPGYRWEAMALEEFLWLRERARRKADFYDGYRIDHVVGFFRTYLIPRHGGAPFFSPGDEAAQIALGERILRLFKEAGGEIIAEDLGTVPDFVRAVLTRLGIPGFRVLRWERDWKLEGQPFREPAGYPALSVAASGTHDTEPLAVWWEQAPPGDRVAVSALASVQRSAGRPLGEAAGPFVREVLVEALFASGSDLLLLPVQDGFGWRDRINDPGDAGAANWTFKLPWPVDTLDSVGEARARRDELRGWSKKHGRM
ncbi:MAG: 4-alpha-glucanotransferase [Acidobacteria bacterium]|nr:4-alpha-glucanotransferase [Acidobacteriota bacterium]